MNRISMREGFGRALAAYGEVNPNVVVLDVDTASYTVARRYLTDGKRGIPLLVAFDHGGAQQFRWGPRPAEAQAVMDAALAAGLEKAARLEKLHLFYGRNRGRALDAELVAVLGRFLDGKS